MGLCIRAFMSGYRDLMWKQSLQLEISMTLILNSQGVVHGCCREVRLLTAIDRAIPRQWVPLGKKTCCPSLYLAHFLYSVFYQVGVQSLVTSWMTHEGTVSLSISHLIAWNSYFTLKMPLTFFHDVRWWIRIPGGKGWLAKSMPIQGEVVNNHHMGPCSSLGLITAKLDLFPKGRGDGTVASP